MNLFEEGHFAIFLFLQLLDGSLLVFVIFSLSTTRRKQVQLSPSTCHKFHWCWDPGGSVHGAGVGDTKTNP